MEGGGDGWREEGRGRRKVQEEGNKIEVMEKRNRMECGEKDCK